MVKWIKKLRKEKNNIEILDENIKDLNEVVEITNLTQYRLELNKGTTNFDFSNLDLTFEDIQNINLENLNLDIDLRQVFVPYNGCGKFGNSILTPLLRTYSGDYFLMLNKSRLSGNNVTGDLSLFEGNSRFKPVYVWYSEETFDENYKSQYPQFFISKDAPEELRKKYYNPQIILKKEIASNPEDEKEQTKTLIRQTLTLDEYLKYYEFLKGKYLGNFLISKQDLIQIEIIEKYGLDQRDQILKHVNEMVSNINQSMDCEKFIINEADDKGVCLTLKLKFKK